MFIKLIILQLMLVMLTGLAEAENSIEINKVRFGVGVGFSQVNAKIPGDATYKTGVANATVNIGYAISPVWEAGLMLTNGIKKNISNGTKTLNIRKTVMPQLYLRGRQLSSDSNLGAFGMMTLGYLKQESNNVPAGVVYSDQILTLGLGAGLSWKMPSFVVDAGFYISDVALSAKNSGVSTLSPGILVSLNYALGDDEKKSRIEHEASVKH